MKKRITVQDIADAVGLSRNTVSKVLNETGAVSFDTKEKILQKAIELGYKQFSYLLSDELQVNSEVPFISEIVTNREIALFTHAPVDSSHFTAPLITAFQQQISQLGYRLVMYSISDSDIEQKVYPLNFFAPNTDGILLIEMFDKSYTDFLSESGIATLYIDTFANTGGCSIQSDILYMENYNSSYTMIQQLMKQGLTEIGFVGDARHCHSFYERYKGYRDAHLDNQLASYNQFCILEKDNQPYSEPKWLAQKISDLEKMPQAFYCANDFITICVLRALKLLNLSVPNNIKLCGYDNSSELKVLEPQLTTVHIYRLAMANEAIKLLLDRIKNPDAPFKTLYVETEVVWRDSTN